MPRGDVIVEVLQRRLAEDEAARIGGAVVKTFERGAIAEENQARGVVGQQPHVAGITLALESGQQARKVDEGCLERVIEDLSRRHRDGLAAVLRLRAVLDPSSWLRCFHLSLRLSMIFSLALGLR